MDVGEAGGYHYFVMECVEGKTLYDDLSRGKVFSEHEALEIITQVARGLAHAHSKGLIHRDVKPKNIMINTAGEVKLADLGLARETTDIETAQTEAGQQGNDLNNCLSLFGKTLLHNAYLYKSSFQGAGCHTQ